MGIFNDPPTVNSRGDTLTEQDKYEMSGTKTLENFATVREGSNLKLTPQQRGEMLYNWLTAGGPPKPVEAGAIFKQRQDLSGVEAKASAGQGINGLFGIGKMIGELTPVVAPNPGSVPTIKMIEPMNQSPMQPGVPYSALPVGGK